MTTGGVTDRRGLSERGKGGYGRERREREEKGEAVKIKKPGGGGFKERSLLCLLCPHFSLRIACSGQ